MPVVPASVGAVLLLHVVTTVVLSFDSADPHAATPKMQVSNKQAKARCLPYGKAIESSSFISSGFHPKRRQPSRKLGIRSSSTALEPARNSIVLDSGRPATTKNQRRLFRYQGSGPRFHFLKTALRHASFRCRQVGSEALPRSRQDQHTNPRADIY